MEEEGRGDVNERDIPLLRPGGGERAEAEDGPGRDAGSSSNRHQVSLGFQRKFHAREFTFMVLSLERNTRIILFAAD